MVTLASIAVVSTLAAVILGEDPESSDAAAVALLAFSIFSVAGLIVLYRRQPKAAPTDRRALVQTTREIAYGIGAIALLLAAGQIAPWFFPEQKWAYKWRYFVDTNLQDAAIEIERKPHDCEFLTAPVGMKHCHYEKTVTTVRVAQGATGLVTSLDEGKTWVPTEQDERPLVLVTWRRVSD